MAESPAVAWDAVLRCEGRGESAIQYCEVCQTGCEGDPLGGGTGPLSASVRLAEWEHPVEVVAPPLGDVPETSAGLFGASVPGVRCLAPIWVDREVLSRPIGPCLWRGRRCPVSRLGLPWWVLQQ